MPDAGVRLWNECSFLVLDRPGYDIPEHLPPNFTELTPLAGSTIVTEEVASRRARARAPTRTPTPTTQPRTPSQTPSLGTRARARALAPSLGPKPSRPRPRQVSSSEIRRRIAKPAVGLRRSSTGGGKAADNFGESEKHEIEQAMSSGGNFEMVDG